MSEWLYRKQFSITNNTLAPATDVQVKFQVYRTAGTSTATDVYIGTNCLEDFSDIRFTDSSGVYDGCYDYWIETPTTSTVATCWVEVGYMPANSATTCYLYYGNNNGVAAYSSGSYTFPFFDDFPGSALDTTTNWDVASGSVTVTGGECTISSGKIKSKTAVTGPLILRGRIKYTNATQWKSFGWCKSGANDAHLFHAKNTGTAMVARSNNNAGIQQEAADLGNYCDNAYHTLELAAVSSSSFKYYVDGSLGATLTYDIGTSLKIQFEATTSDIIADWILIRKYAATEPTVSGWIAAEDLTVDDDTPTGYTTTAYRIVGIEYDQNKGVFIIEFGAVEDYYMTQDAKYRGAYNNTLSLL